MKQFMVSAGVCAFVMLSAPVQAQDIENELAACVGIKNPLERLVCFDKVAAGEAVAAAQPAELSQRANNNGNAVATSKADNFGSEHVRKNSTSSDAEQPDKLDITIAKYSKNALGYLRIETTDGQVWQQTTSERFPFDPDARYFIERGAFSAYYLGRTDMNARIRVKRIE